MESQAAGLLALALALNTAISMVTTSATFTRALYLGLAATQRCGSADRDLLELSLALHAKAAEPFEPMSLLRPHQSQSM